MTILDTHAQGEPYRRDDEHENLVEAGGAHLLGLWAAGLMGLEEAHLQDYAAFDAFSLASGEPFVERSKPGIPSGFE